jgi:hypothetical protein
MCFIMPSFCTDAMYFDTIHSFSFPLPPSPSPIEQSHYCKHVLYINVCALMFCFFLIFILNHWWENLFTEVANIGRLLTTFWLMDGIVTVNRIESNHFNLHVLNSNSSMFSFTDQYIFEKYCNNVIGFHIQYNFSYWVSQNNDRTFPYSQMLPYQSLIIHH